MMQIVIKMNVMMYKGIEIIGIEIVKELQCIVWFQDFFFFWFVLNVLVFGMSYGVFMLGFGVFFWQVIVVIFVGVIVFFGFCGIIVIVGKCGFVLMMVLFWVVFGIQGNKIFGVIFWMILIGWEIFFVIIVVLVMMMIFC